MKWSSERTSIVVAWLFLAVLTASFILSGCRDETVENFDLGLVKFHRSYFGR